jgi:hypothetical protein
MKRYSNTRIICLIIIFVFSIMIVYSQPQPPTGNAGQLDPIGGPAPLGSGIITLVMLAAGHGLRKYFKFIRDKLTAAAED